MAFVIAIGSEKCGSCVEEIRVGVRRKALRIALVCLEFLLRCTEYLNGTVVRQ